MKFDPLYQKKISVCMATYNGEKYIKEQINSILELLTYEDEIIIFDDNSSDNTVKILDSLNDDRIQIYIKSNKRGEVSSFSQAISKANNEIIFLSDQDDIWKQEKIIETIEYFRDSHVGLITSNFDWIDKNGDKVDIYYDGVLEQNSKKYFNNILDIFIGKTNYFGCAMAFRSELKKLIVPIPNFVESHDLWIALIGNITRSNLHLDKRLFLKRNHSSNATSTISSRPVYKKLYSRLIFLVSILLIYLRLFRLSVSKLI